MQLLYPWFSLGLLAVGIPVIIHLLQLRRPKRLLFTNTAFIRDVELVTVRHRKLQSLLVLLARVLAVVALVLVFCQPFIPAKRNMGGGISVGIGILVDNSFSMKLMGATQESLFNDAVNKAKALVQSSTAETKFKLLNSSGGMMLGPAFQQKLDDLKPSAEHLFIKGNSLGNSKIDESGTRYIISDFQKNAVRFNQIDSVSTGQQVVLIPLVAKKSANVYIDSLWLDDAFVRVQTNVALHVRVRNGGSLAAGNCPVKVFLGLKQVAAFQVNVAPRQAVVSVVQVQLNDEQLVLGRVIAEDAPVTFDNTYYFTLQPARAIRILEVGTEPVARQLYGNEPLFAYSFAKPRAVDYGILRQANLVLLREIDEIGVGLRDGLRAVLKRGGSVVVVPSALAKNHDQYQRLFQDLGLGAVQWEATAATPELREIAMPNAAEPFFRDVFGAQQRAVTMPRVAPVLRWPRTGTDILRMRDGESYLANFTSGAGRVYVFSAPFAKEYSDFVAHALFVPVLYRVAMLSYRDEQRLAYRLTQESLSLKLPTASEANPSGAGRAEEASFRFLQDSLTLIPGQRVVGQEVRLEVPAGMNKPGFYQIQQRGRVLTTLAFNQDKRESELAAYSADELRQMIGPNHPNIQVLEGGAAGSSAAQLRADQTGQPLWRYFLAVALLCLLAEALLVRFGSRRVTAATKARMAA